MDSLPALVGRTARRSPTATALVEPGNRLSYAAFWRRAQLFAHHLRDMGLRPGERVAIVLPNGVEAAVAIYGTWLAGGVAASLNVQARSRDLLPWLRHCDARVLVQPAEHADASAAAAEIGPPLQRLIAGSLPWPAETADAAGIGDADALLPLPEEPALILYTSGTTGAPKGVTLSHGNLLANARAVVAYLQLRDNDSVLSVLPFYYAYGASVLHTHLIAGACVHLADNLVFPHLLVEYLQRERISGFSGVPSTFALLLDRVPLQDYDLSALRYLTQAGGAMAPALTRRLRLALPGPQLFVMYGQTEATSRITWLPPERLDDKPGSVGIPIDGVALRILREDGAVAAHGQPGEVCVQGPGVMLGYWQDPAATARTLKDGWLHTGDVGHLDADGFLYLDGRRSDMIKTGAHRVFPGDIEEAIAELPGVSEVAAIGIDDDVLGQVIKAYVVAQPGAAQDAAAIRAHCRQRLAPYKIPRHIAFVGALPRTASGKIRRAALAETAGAAPGIAEHAPAP